MGAAPIASQDRPWGAEREVDASIARALVREAFPEVGAERLEASDTDWDNSAWLVDDAGAGSGVIDWGDVHLGEPALELSIAYGFLPPTAREDFFDGLGYVLDGSAGGSAGSRD